MKPRDAIIVFVLLIGSAVMASVHSYRTTEGHMVADMNQALALTLQHKQEGWITPDTIADYRSHLRTEVLRRQSIIYYALDDRQKGLCSRPMKWQKNNRHVRFQGYANCSMASVLMLSDQTLPLSLVCVAALWGMAAMRYFKKRSQEVIVLGNMEYHIGDDLFYGADHQPVRFTPMQQQLMILFYTTASHTLHKQQICDALWPKKPDASDTLYTLIRRIRPIIEEHGGLSIVSERAKCYKLKKAR